MLCKDRVFETFRSLYTQQLAQSSVLRRSFVFNAEVAEYACISRMASRDHNMAQNGIVEQIPGLSAQFVITSPSTDPDCLHHNCIGRKSYSFSTSLLRSLLLFLRHYERILGVRKDTVVQTTVGRYV